MLTDHKHINRNRIRSLVDDVDSDAAQGLISRHVDPTPLGFGPDRAIIRDNGVSVWVVIADLSDPDSTVESVADDFDLSRDAVHAAVFYYLRDPDPVDARILLNQSSFQG